MILSREEVSLNDVQNKLIISGWGKKVFDETVLCKIIYESGDKEIQGYLSYPKTKNVKYPLIIWNRGGSKADGRIDDFLAKGMFGEIASWGYVVLASNYREEDEFGGKDLNDVMNLIPLSDEIENCDSENIGMEGWSRGGMMTYLALCRTDRIKCAVIISGLADLFRSENDRNGLAKIYKRLFGCKDEDEFENRKKTRSAVYFADRINKDTKILLLHGTDDKEISYLDSVEMFEKLKDNGIGCRLELFEGGDHYLKQFRKETSDLRKKWFNKFLKNEIK